MIIFAEKRLVAFFRATRLPAGARECLGRKRVQFRGPGQGAGGKCFCSDGRKRARKSAFFLPTVWIGSREEHREEEPHTESIRAACQGHGLDPDGSSAECGVGTAERWAGMDSI
jgi:hypothetical protein